MKSPHEFYLETNGKYIGNGQCWGLWDKFTMDYVNEHFRCLWVGGAKDMWYHFKELHLDIYFEQITDRHKLQDGDWLVWDPDTNPLCWISKARNEKGIAYGHIAMFRQYNPSNPEQNVILTQNPNGNPNYTHQMVADFLGFVGALRPKCYIKNDTVKEEIKVEESIKEENNLTNNENHDSIETNQGNNTANEKENVIYWLFELIAKFVIKILKRKE